VHAVAHLTEEVDDVRWAFWRRRTPAPQRALPDDVGLPTASRPSARAVDSEQEDRLAGRPVPRSSGAVPSSGPEPTYDPPPAAPAPGLDRAALAGAGPDVAQLVRDAHAGTGGPADADPRVLAAAATGALAARLPALSGVDGAVQFDEPEDELLHAYADLLVGRAQRRPAADADDLLAVAHLAAAAAAVGAAADPALLLLAGVPPQDQARTAALLLAQTADDGGDPPERLADEVRALFQG
jgi:hypothetical protein